jgi:hypothetical protein
LLLSAASPGEEEETVRRWSFRAAGDLRGWEAGSGIADLRVEGGRLRGRITHPDAYLYAPALRVPLDGLLLKVRWSCPRGGSGQCYFATADRPSLGEDRVISREVEGGRMVETAFPLEGADGPAPAVPLTLTRFRLDPFNGNEDVPFEIEEVTLFRLPARFETAFAPSRSSVAVGEEAEFGVRLRPLDGRRIAEAIEATVDDGAGHRFPLRLDPGGAVASCRFAFRAPGTHSVRAVLSRAGAKIEELEATIAVGLPPEPAGPLIASGEMALELLSTFYIVNWFGVLVQWCGLEWAWKVLDLCDLREDSLLRAVADGVARSGLQQTFDREPWTGLYPDVWDLRGNWAGGALLHPQLIIEALRAGGHLPQPLRTWTRRVGEGREALLVEGWGRVLSFEGGPERLKLAVSWIPGEPGEILIARSPRPRSVSVGGAPLTGDGLRYDETRRLLGARFVAPGEEIRIEVVYGQ